MLQSLSDGIRNSKWLGWLIVGLITVPFALWGIGSYLGVGEEAYVAKVNGVEISAREYERAYYQQRNALASQFGGRLPAAFAEADFIKTQTVDSLINRELLLQTVADNGYRVADDTVRSEIVSAAQFQIDGRFDKEAYERQLRSLGLSPLQYEDDLRRAMALQQMRDGVVATAFYSPAELAQMKRLRTQTRSADTLLFAAADFSGDGEVSEAEIEEYFAANSETFYAPEAVRLDYVELDQNALAATVEVSEEQLRAAYDEQLERFTTPDKRFASHILIKVPSTADEAVVEEKRALAAQLRERILAGESFADLAREFSEDPGSAKQGGDLGEVPRGVMVRPFEDAVYALEEGELSEPVRTAFGFHLIRLERLERGSVKPFAEVRDELRRSLQQREAENLFYDRVDVLANESYENSTSLAPVAEATGLALQTSGWIERGRGDGIGAERAVRAAAFSAAVLEERLNSDLIELGPNHVVVLRLTEHRPRAAQALDDVREQVRAAILAERAAAAAAAAADQSLQALREGGDVAAIAERFGAQLQRYDALARTAVEPEPALRDALFKMPRPQGEAPGFSRTRNAAGDPVVLVLHTVGQGESETVDAASTQQALGRSEYDAWLQALRAAASIERREELL